MAYQSNPKVTTPRGVAIWPRLNEPDTKYDAAGVYEAKIAIDGSDPALAKLQAQVEGLIDAEYNRIVAELTEAGKAGVAKKITKVSPFKAEEDDATGEETGRVIIKGKMKASGISKKTNKPWKRRPNIFNGRGILIQNPPKIGGGSILKLNVELSPYYNASDKVVGVSFRLEAVQVIKLVSFGAADAASCGFTAEDDGDDFDNAASDFGVEDNGPSNNTVDDDSDI